MNNIDFEVAEILAEADAEVAEVFAPAVETEEEIIEDDVLVENKPEIPVPVFHIGDEVKLIPGAKYASGGEIPKNLFNSKLYVRTVKNGSYGIGIKTTGRIAGSVEGKNLIAYTKEVPAAEPEIKYLVLIKAEKLDIKSRPEENSKTLKTIHKGGLYTVIGEKNGWGHLKIGGWIPLDQVKKIGA